MYARWQGIKMWQFLRSGPHCRADGAVPGVWVEARSMLGSPFSFLTQTAWGVGLTKCCAVRHDCWSRKCCLFDYDYLKANHGISLRRYTHLTELDGNIEKKFTEKKSEDFKVQDHLFGFYTKAQIHPLSKTQCQVLPTVGLLTSNHWTFRLLISGVMTITNSTLAWVVWVAPDSVDTLELDDIRQGLGVSDVGDRKSVV